MTDAGLAQFEGSAALTNLVIFNNAGVTDAGLAHLKACINLKRLLVQKTNVTAAGIDEPRKALPNCGIEWDGMIDVK